MSNHEARFVIRHWRSARSSCPWEANLVPGGAMSPKDDIKAIDSIVKKLGLSEAQRDILHDVIHHERLTYREILEAAREVKRDFPNK